jgi:hypothetical protein
MLSGEFIIFLIITATAAVQVYTTVSLIIINQCLSWSILPVGGHNIIFCLYRFITILFITFYVDICCLILIVREMTPL